MNSAAFLIIDQFVANYVSYFYERLAPPYRSDTVRANYIPCVTPVGHATLSLGCMPREHGVIGRKWFTREFGSLDEVDIELFAWNLYRNRAPRGFLHERKILANNLCRQFEGWFCLVASAKDFVSYLLGGDTADVLIYPLREIDRWTIVFRTRAWASLIRQIAFQILNHLNTLAQEARVSVPSGSINDLGYDSATTSYRFTFPLFRPNSDQAIAVDRFFARCVNSVIGAVPSERNVMLAHSFYSCDWVGHEHGCSSAEYRKNMDELAKIIRELLRWLNDRSQADPVWVITGDHGGRQVKGEILLDAIGPVTYERVSYSYLTSPARCGVPYVGGVNEEIQLADLMYIYGRGGAGPTRKDLLIDGCTTNPLNIGASVLANSFNSDNLPDQIEVPEENWYLTQKCSNFHGYHGAGYTSAVLGMQRCHSDCTIPILTNDVSRPLPTSHDMVRSYFVDLCRRRFGGHP